MPQVIPVIAYYIASYLGASGVVAAAIAVVASAATNSYQQQKAARKARDAYNSSLTDRLQMTQTYNAARSLVYGRVRNVDGVLFKGVWGPNNGYYTLFIALAGHEIDAIEQIYFNDQLIEIDGSGVVTTAPFSKPNTITKTDSLTASGNQLTLGMDGATVKSVFIETDGAQTGYQFRQSGRTITIVNSSVSDGTVMSVTYQYASFDSYATVYKYLGAPGQDLSAQLISRFPTQCNSSHKFEGVAGLLVDFFYNTDAYPTGVPSVSAVIRGRKVYDPRTGTTAWSENPALCARDFALHPNGGGCSSSEIDDASFIAAANACDVSHTYTLSDGSSQAVPLFRCGYVAKTDVSPETHLGELVESMAGKSGWAGGKLKVRAGVYTSPVVTLDDSYLSSIGGQHVIVSGLGMADVSNIVRPTIADASNSYTPTALTEVRATAYITQDGVELPIDQSMTAVTFAPQSQHIAGVLMRDQRQGMQLTWPCNMRAWPVDLFDTVAINSTRYGWSGKAFEVLGWQHTPQSGVILTLKETGPDIYTPDAVFSTTDMEPNTTLPLPWSVPIPTGLAVSEALAQQGDGSLFTIVKVSWDLVPDAGVQNSGGVEVQYTLADSAVPSGDWPTVKVLGSATSVSLQGLIDGRPYLFRIRSANTLVRGSWSDSVLHTVLGKTALPSDVSGLDADDDAVRWSPAPDLDLAGYELRWQPGTNKEWESAQPLHTGLLTSSPYTWTIRPSGAITLMCKAVDTSGNYSRNAAVVYITLTGSVVRNTVESHAYAPTFSGTINSGSVSGSNLVAPVASLAFGESNRLAFGNPDEPFFGVIQYGSIDYISAWWTPALSQIGDHVLLNTTITNAVGLQVEYQSDTGLAFGAPGADAFGIPSDPFFDGAAADWLAWPGYITANPGAQYRWRLRCQSSDSQASLSVMTAYVDGPDIEEIVPVTAIAAPGGSRFALTKSYRSLTAVVATIQAGSTAITVEVQDMNASLGPLVKALDATRTAVAASASALIKGY